MGVLKMYNNFKESLEYENLFVHYRNCGVVCLNWLRFCAKR